MRPTERFSDRVRDYVRYRPSYPIDIVRTLERDAGIAPDRTRVVDLGCGTGISSGLFLNCGYAVTGIEPNAAMREAAKAKLGGRPRFRVLAGSAENVPLPDSCCELLIAAQAFHWFDPEAARPEMKRVLADGGTLALVWNERRTDSTPFLREYENILRRRGTDYGKVVHRNWTDTGVADFFGPDGCERRTFDSHQDFDLEGLSGRAMSSSYVPGPGNPGHIEFMDALTDAFEQCAVGGVVRFEYDTKVYFGGLS